MPASTEDQYLWEAENELKRQHLVDSIKADRKQYRRHFGWLLTATLLALGGVPLSAILGSVDILPGGGVATLIVVCSLMAVASFVSLCFRVEGNDRNFDAELRDAEHALENFRLNPQRHSGEAPMTQQRAEAMVTQAIKIKTDELTWAAKQFSEAATMLCERVEDGKDLGYHEWQKIRAAQQTRTQFHRS